MAATDTIIDLLRAVYSGGAINVNSGGGSYATQLDEASSTITYVGKAATGSLLNRFSAEDPMLAFTAIPDGYTPPYSWAMGRISGGMASHTLLTAAISGTGTASGGKALTAALSAAIALTNGDLGLIVSLLAAISGSGTLTNADLAATAGLSAAISASGTITDAQLGAIVAMLANLSASGTLSLDNFATANMEADISSVTELSPQSLANAVWTSVLADYPDAGTAGKALADAGAAGNPWSALLVDNGDPGTFGERVQKLLQVAQFLGLK
jgi:hypothetical protein